MEDATLVVLVGMVGILSLGALLFILDFFENKRKSKEKSKEA